MKVSEIGSEDTLVKRIFLDHYSNRDIYRDRSQKKHYQCSIELLLHKLPTLSKEAQERARKTILNIEAQMRSV